MFTSWIYNFENKELTNETGNHNSLSIDDFVMSLPPGVYTTLRTVNHKKAIFQLSYHFKRLYESFKLSGHDFNFSLDDLRDPLRFIFEQEVAEELRIRLFIPFDTSNICYILSEKLTQPSSFEYQNGVKADINHLHRDNPRAKLTSFIRRSEKIKKLCKENNLEESIIVNKKGELLEGLSSNFFAIKNGVVFTAAKEVLNGSIREIVMDEITRNSIPLQLKPILINDLDIIDEAFITSTSRGVLPIIQISETVIGSGKPGEITNLLTHKLEERLLREAEPI